MSDTRADDRSPDSPRAAGAAPPPPLGWPGTPLPEFAPSARSVRVVAAVLLFGCVAVLGVAARLTPSPRGYGTHTQLGLAPCGMLITTGLPCPTCGMTTAFSYTMRGDFLHAFLAQPGGLLLALIAIATVFISAWMLITGRQPTRLMLWLTPFRLSAILLLILVGGWAFCLIHGLATGTLPMRSVPVG